MSLVEFIYNKLKTKYDEDTEAAVAVGVIAAVAGAVAGAATGAIGTVAGAAGEAVAAVAVLAVAAVVAVVTGAVVTVAVALTVCYLIFHGLTNPIEPLTFITLTILLTEIFFWTSKKKPKKKENTFHFTIKRKILSLIESVFWIIQINGAYHGIPFLINWIGLNQKTLVAILFGIGIITILLGIGFIWIKINETKYKRGKKNGS